MKVCSFRDLQVCTKFAGMNEIEMLALSNDDAMSLVLEQIGFDVEYPISYVPLNHRDMQNNVGLGFMAVGTISLNKAFINSKICSLTERMIALVHEDISLARELGNLVGMRVNFRSLLEDGSSASDENLLEYMLEPNRDLVGQQIKDLEAVRDVIRGEMYNDRGEPKTFAEYKVL